MKQEKSIKFSPVKDRVLQVIDSKGDNPNKFYVRSGVTRGVLTQKNGISEKNIARILATYPDLNPDWLLTGKGPMLRGGSNTPDTPAATQIPAEQASPIKIPSSQSDARQLAIHVLDHVKELEQQPIFMSYIKQKAYEIALDIVTEKLPK